jgi:serine/threonine-protein kinase
MQHRTFNPLTAWQIIRPITDALGYGHDYQVLHRDLKSGNILIEPSGQGNHPYLTDFGLGKRLGFDATLTAMGVAVGTPEYMAPEVAMGAQADHRSDLYSFGVLMYEMLLGQLPFQEKNQQMTALAHVDKPVPTPRSLHPLFPPSLEAVLMQTLCKNPDDRFQSAEELRQAYYEAVKTLPEGAQRTCFWMQIPDSGNGIQ